MHLPFDWPKVGEHRIDQTDCLDWKPLSAYSCDLTITSPHFNIGMAYDGSGESDAFDYNECPKFTKLWHKNTYYWTRDTVRI